MISITFKECANGERDFAYCIKSRAEEDRAVKAAICAINAIDGAESKQEAKSAMYMALNITRAEGFTDGLELAQTIINTSPRYEAYKAEIKKLLDACPDNDITEELAKLIAEGDNADV